MTKSRKIIIYFSFILFSSLIAQQMPNNKRAKGLIRQYGFSAYSVADAYSDSIRVLSYLSVPNHVLQFIKSVDGRLPGTYIPTDCKGTFLYSNLFLYLSI